MLNRIELVYPFLDNIRPSQNLLPMLFKKDFGLGLRVLFQHIPFMLKVIPKKYYRYMFRDFLVFLLAVAAPIGVMIYLLVKAWKGGPSLAVPETGLPGALVQRSTQVLGSLLMPVLISSPGWRPTSSWWSPTIFETGSGMSYRTRSCGYLVSILTILRSFL
jgi:hypothetical protein